MILAKLISTLVSTPTKDSCSYKINKLKGGG